MQVRLATSKDKKSWDTYVDSRPDATPYSRFAWKEAVEQAYSHKPCYLLAEAYNLACELEKSERNNSERKIMEIVDEH